jgi:hypothetical protein
MQLFRNALTPMIIYTFTCMNYCTLKILFKEVYFYTLKPFLIQDSSHCVPTPIATVFHLSYKGLNNCSTLKKSLKSKIALKPIMFTYLQL